MESPPFRCVAPCAEFPNDNPLLYREPGPVEVRVQAGEATAEVEPVLAAAPCEESVAEPVADAGTDPAPPVLEADDETDDIEIVDDLVIEDAIEEAPSMTEEAPSMAQEAPSMPPPAPDDAFAALVAVLEEVARAAGASDAASHTLRTLLGRERLAADAPPEQATMRAAASAWAAILRGESEDFGACGAATLDEWSSIVIATALGEPARADTLRRELRRRGVAAFGLVVEAA